MKSEVSVVLVGAGGYGRTYARALLSRGKEEGLRLVGVVEPFPIGAPELDALAELGGDLYPSLSAFYEKNSADLCVISSPIQFHKEQTEQAMKNGSHVLCEKPVCAVVQDALAMIKARDAWGKLLGIGYQWSFSPAVHAAKADIAAGMYGKPITLKTMMLWPRNRQYYTRGIGWAGSRKDAQGRWVLDNVVSNATAHYLHNLLYLLGDAPDRSAEPVSVQASLFRANPIDMYDTAFLRVVTKGGAEVLYYGSHAVKQLRNPLQELIFENGTIRFDSDAEGRFIGTLKDGRVIDYGSPDEDHNRGRKLFTMADAVRGECAVPCGVEAAMMHTRVMNGAVMSMQPTSFPKEAVTIDGEPELYHVGGLEEIITACYQQQRMPTAADAAWATVGNEIDISELNEFNG